MPRHISGGDGVPPLDLSRLRGPSRQDGAKTPVDKKASESGRKQLEKSSELAAASRGRKRKAKRHSKERQSKKVSKAASRHLGTASESKKQVVVPRLQIGAGASSHPSSSSSASAEHAGAKKRSKSKEAKSRKSRSGSAEARSKRKHSRKSKSGKSSSSSPVPSLGIGGKGMGIKLKLQASTKQAPVMGLSLGTVAGPSAAMDRFELRDFVDRNEDQLIDAFMQSTANHYVQSGKVVPQPEGSSVEQFVGQQLTSIGHGEAEVTLRDVGVGVNNPQWILSPDGTKLGVLKPLGLPTGVGNEPIRRHWKEMAVEGLQKKIADNPELAEQIKAGGPEAATVLRAVVADTVFTSAQTSLKTGIPYQDLAVNEQIAAVLGKDLNVPETSMIFVPGKGVCTMHRYADNIGSTMQPDNARRYVDQPDSQSLQNMALLDLMMIARDRHPDNMLVAENAGNTYSLIPIDQGYSLPQAPAFSDLEASWMTLPPCRAPLTEESIKWMRALDWNASAAQLDESVGSLLTPESKDVLCFTTHVLQESGRQLEAGQLSIVGVKNAMLALERDLKVDRDADLMGTVRTLAADAGMSLQEYCDGPLRERVASSIQRTIESENKRGRAT